MTVSKPAAISRWAAGVEYDGSGFSGWQSQKDAPSVQAEIERALSLVADHPVTVVAAGRTDAGVHALQQVIHFDSTALRAERAWLLGTNRHLPPTVALRWVQPVALTFHARFSAQARRYRYVIYNSRTRSALGHRRVCWETRPLDESAMHRAGQALLGEHDFSAFRDSQCQAPTPIRTVHALSVVRHGEQIVLDITANAFLHHMVRNIAGTLMEVGLGLQAESWVGDVLRAGLRTQAGMTADAGGLYFLGPQYPAPFSIPPPPAIGFFL